MKVVDNIIVVHELVLHGNDMDTTMYGSIPEEYDDAKKFLTGNGICDCCSELHLK